MKKILVCLAAVATVAAGLLAAAADSVGAPVPSGSLQAVGICPFDYHHVSQGESYAHVGYAGTLTGFTPDTTYYVLQLNPTSSATGLTPAVKTADANGELVFTGEALPELQNGTDRAVFASAVKTIRIAISTSSAPYDAQSSGTDVVYRPFTPLVNNPACNPWTMPTGTTFSDATQSLDSSNITYSFGDRSNNGRATGNFALTRGTTPNAPTVLWSTRTSGSGNTLVLQADGNLVVYDSAHRARWQSHTYKHPGDRLVLQRDGNLVIYTNGHPLWQTHTYGR